MKKFDMVAYLTHTFEKKSLKLYYKTYEGK